MTNPDQSSDLSGRIALVTGASSGIGRATAARIARSGAQLIVAGRDAPRLDAVMREIGAGAEAELVDLAEAREIASLMQRVAARHGRLDILVINAGVSNAPEIGELTPASYDRLMDVNVRGSVFTFVEALPLLADGASVVFVGSVAGRKGQPGDPLYAGSKGFIRAFVRNAGTSRELMARRIRVNVVSPGPIETPMVKEMHSDEVRAGWLRLVPQRRYAPPQEIAGAASFLLDSSKASFVTGQILAVDGGFSAAGLLPAYP